MEPLQDKQNTEPNKQLEILKQLQPKQSIQDAFKKFQKEKFYQLKLNKYLKQTEIDRSSKDFKDQLRTKFIETAKKYIGIPYAQKYLKPSDPLYSSPLFLDCCAFIRQVVFDLRAEFGFTLGKWNQAYQYDLLPDEGLQEEDLKPGDIIFYSAYYYDKRIKPFPHDMVHVELYMGEGKSLGARWQKGAIQVFDSYKFKSTLYYDIKYHYRSIDSWLGGILKSYCDQHRWLDDRANEWLSEKFSVFADPTLDDVNIVEKEVEGVKDIFIGKGSHLKLVRSYFGDLQKYHILPEKEQFSNHYFLKWVQTAGEIHYFSFKEGKQLVNHVPNMSILTTKSALLKTLCEHVAKILDKEEINIDLNSFIPKTYRLDVMSDEIEFLNDKTDGIWIYKPRNMNQGRGICLIGDIIAFKAEFLESKKFYLGEYSLNNMLYYKPELAPKASSEHKYSQLKQDGLIQHYISPLLLNGYKFDIRCYVLVNTTPEIVLFSRGYLRLTLEKYTLEDLENPDKLFIHLTNNCFQRKHKEYKTRGDSSIAKWDMLEKEIGQEKLLQLEKSIKKILLFVYASAKEKIERKKGFFELLGCDIIVSDKLQPYLLQVNTNPALFLDTTVQKEVIPPVLNSTLDIALGVFANPTEYRSICDKYSHVFDVLYDPETDKDDKLTSIYKEYASQK